MSRLLAAALTLLFSFGLLWWVTPSVQVIGESGEKAGLPVVIKQELAYFDVRIVLRCDFLRPRWYQLQADNGVDALIINGYTLNVANLAWDFSRPRSFDLGPFLHPGTNVIEVRAYNDYGPGGVDLNVDRRDPLITTLLAIGLIALGIVLFEIVKRSAFAASGPQLAGLVTVGVLARILYAIVTPYWVRQYDLGAHLEYIRHLQDKAAMPHYRSGYELYHPPLYYALAAIVAMVGPIVSESRRAGEYAAEALSVGMAIGGFLLCVRLSRALFSGRQAPQALFVAVCSVLPALVFQTTRISNDALVHFLMLWAIVLNMEWWQQQERRKWFQGWLLMALAALTKASSLVLPPAAMVIGLLKTGRRWTAKLIDCFLAVAMFAGLSGWYFYKRIVVEGQRNVIGSIRHVPAGLRVSNDCPDYVWFNPWEVGRILYNDTWDDSYRRNYFWEFAFRSVFFGEFRFEGAWRWIATVLVLAGMGFVDVGIWGFVRKWRCAIFWTNMPVVLFVAAAFGGLLFHRYVNPFSCHQDTRLIAFALPPAVGMLTLGVEACSPRLRAAGYFLGWLTAAISLLFLVSLFFHPSPSHHRFELLR